jgi:glyoxylase-like metal-dependent hydrolase (beta-lactamase superfamily II)
MIDVGYGEFVMIDCGAGERESFEKIIGNIRSIGYDPGNLKALILTHCHIDHIGSASVLKDNYNCDTIAHELDAPAIEGHDKTKTAASWYGIAYKPVTVDRVFTGELENCRLGEQDFKFIHTPGHTPGSISVFCEISDTKILFGQDIHGPFDPSFGSNINDWKTSMMKLLELNADILCEGHYGVFKGKEQVKEYIEGYLNKYSV